MIFYIPFGLDVGAILYCVSVFFEPFFRDFLDCDFFLCLLHFLGRSEVGGVLLLLLL